jgi:putative PIN family toxin of toxin-antitoxin system
VNRLTLDSNVYISAVVYGGEPKRLMDMGLEGKIRMFITDEILAETSRVLIDKFKFDAEDRLPKAQAYIKRTERVVPAVKLDVVKDDSDDNKILECAVHSNSEKVITNDGDLLRMKIYAGIRIMKVNEFLRGPGVGR